MTTARARRLEHTHTTGRRGRRPVGARLLAPRAHAAPAAPQRAASEARRGLRTPRLGVRPPTSVLLVCLASPGVPISKKKRKAQARRRRLERAPPLS